MEYLHRLELFLRAKGVNLAKFHGKDRAKALEAFQEDPEVAVLLLSKDGSHGLDLSFASHVFLLDEIWDKSLEEQVVARAYRMGCAGPVEIDQVVLEHTVEHLMHQVSAERAKAITGIDEEALLLQSAAGASTSKTSKKSQLKALKTKFKDQAKIHYILESVRLTEECEEVEELVDQDVGPDGSSSPFAPTSAVALASAGSVESGSKAPLPPLRFRTEEDRGDADAAAAVRELGHPHPQTAAAAAPRGAMAQRTRDGSRGAAGRGKGEKAAKRKLGGEVGSVTEEIRDGNDRGAPSRQQDSGSVVGKKAKKRVKFFSPVKEDTYKDAKELSSTSFVPSSSSEGEEETTSGGEATSQTSATDEEVDGVILKRQKKKSVSFC